MFFSQDWRERVKAENPDAGFGVSLFFHYSTRSTTHILNFLSCIGEVGKLLGAKWKEMDDSEKKPYIEQAAHDKARAKEEKAAYDVRISSVLSIRRKLTFNRGLVWIVQKKGGDDDRNE